MAGGAAGAADALARFQAENGVANVDADAIYSYDKTDQVPLALPQPQPGARRSRRGLPPHPSGVAFPSIAPARPQLTALVLPAAEACSRFTRASSPLTPERRRLAPLFWLAPRSTRLAAAHAARTRMSRCRVFSLLALLLLPDSSRGASRNHGPQTRGTLSTSRFQRSRSSRWPCTRAPGDRSR